MADRYNGDRPQKKRKHDDQGYGHSRSQHHGDQRQRRPDNQKGLKSQKLSHGQALEKLPPPISQLDDIPSYVHFTVSSTDLPPLPEVKDGNLCTAPFVHKSAVSYNRSTSSTQPTDVTYEKLEFLGDAQLELIASRLIYQRFSHLLAGQQSQLRELLVKNETLAEYARAYGFDKRVQVGDFDRMLQDSKERGNKGFNKVLGDVFEAYVAAVVLSDLENGFAVAEKWMTALWAPKLYEAAQNDRFYTRDLSLHSEKGANPLEVYNPAAKAELQKRIAGRETKLEYEPYREPMELKGDQLGQNKHFIALYLTGYGYERKLLGKGEGKNKVEAGNVAATEAMHGDCKGIVDECEKQLNEIKAKKKAEREAREAASKDEPAARLSHSLDAGAKQLAEAIEHWRTAKTKELDFVCKASTVSAAADIGIFSWNDISDTFRLAKALFYFSLSLSLWAVITSAQQFSVVHAFPPYSHLQHTAVVILRRKAGSSAATRRNFAELNMLYVRQCPLMPMSYAWVCLLLALTLDVCSPLTAHDQDDGRRIAISYLGTGLDLFLKFIWALAWVYWTPVTGWRCEQDIVEKQHGGTLSTATTLNTLKTPVEDCKLHR